LLGRDSIEVGLRQQVLRAQRLRALERRLCVHELGFSLLQCRLFRRDLGFEKRRRHRDEPLTLLYVIADVDENLRHAVAADLGRDDDVLPCIQRAVHRNRAGEVDALERRGRDRHDRVACAGGIRLRPIFRSAAGRDGHERNNGAERDGDAKPSTRCMKGHVGVVLD
jgi:hypothetical protein